jgi:hypothetical protein
MIAFYKSLILSEKAGANFSGWDGSLVAPCLDETGDK